MPLTLYDYSDRELLHIVHEVAEENGGSAPSAEIANALGLTEKTRAQSVGSRMSALKRFGVIEKIDRTPSEWRLNAVGHALAFGTIRAAQTRAVDEAKLEELVLLVRQMAQRQFQTPGAAQHLIRREWRRSTWIGMH